MSRFRKALKVLQDKRYRLTAVEVELYGTEREKRIAEEQREKAEEETRELTAQKEKLSKEIAPLSAAAEEFARRGKRRTDGESIADGGRFRHAGNAEKPRRAEQIERRTCPRRRGRQDFGKKVKIRLYFIKKGDQKYAGEIP